MVLTHVGNKTIEKERMILRRFEYSDNESMRKNWISDDGGNGIRRGNQEHLTMSRIELINGSCADQTVDVVVNAANSGLFLDVFLF